MEEGQEELRQGDLADRNHRGVLWGAPMSFSTCLRVLSVSLLLVGCGRTTEPSPPPPPGVPVVRIDNVLRGLTDASLLAAFTARDGRVWVGGNVAALFYRDGGDWAFESVPVEGIITGIWQHDDGRILIVAGHQLLARDVGSPIWEVMPLDNNAILLDLWGLDGERMFIGGTAGTILRHDDGVWTRAQVPVGTEIWGFAGTSEDDLVAVGQSGTIVESVDGGVTWSSVPSPTQATLFAVAGDGAGRFVAVGSGGTVLLRDGDSWELTSTPTQQNLFDVRSNGPGSFVVVGDGGVLFEGDGLSWQPLIEPALHENLRAITGAPGSRTVVGWYGAILDEADQWRASHSGSRLYTLHAPAVGNPMVVGQGGAAFERQNGSWRSITIPTPASLYGIAGPDGNDRIVVGDSGTVLHFDGVTWRQEDVPYVGLLRAVWYDGTRAMAVGEGGVVLVREGGAWRQVASPTLKFLRHVGGLDWNRLIVVGDSGTLLRWDGSRLAQVQVPTQQNLRAVLMRQQGDGYVVGDNGVLLYYRNGTWSRQLGPSLNSMRAIHEVDRVVYIAGEVGHLFRLDQDGWTAVQVEQVGFWLGLGGIDELIVAGELGTIGHGVR